MKHSPLLIALLALLAGCGPSTVAKSKPAEAKGYSAPEMGKKLTPDELIAAGKTQVKNDPEGAIGWGQLAYAYLSKSRMYDSYDDARLAEQSARKSLELRRNGNVMSAVRLTQSLLNQHRFQDALVSSKDALAIASHSPPAQVSRIECLLETGQYEEATQLFSKFAPNLPERDKFLVQSRLLDIYGQPDTAIQLITKLIDSPGTERSTDEALAFLYIRLGDLNWSVRNLDQAEKSYAKALELTPRTWKAMLGTIRVKHAKRDWPAVVKLGHETEELVSMTDVVALMGDAFKAMGDTKMAQEHYGEAAQLAGYEAETKTHSHGNGETHRHGPGKKHGHPLDRQYAHFAADRNRDLDNALKAAKEDLKQRQDIAGWDTLAWVHYKRGELALAKAAMKKAIRTGSKDATILAHKQAILGEGI